MPLTIEEIAWIKKLQRVLELCPDRIELVTTGDPNISIVSNEKYSEYYDGNSLIDGVLLAYINGKPIVHGVSG